MTPILFLGFHLDISYYSSRWNFFTKSIIYVALSHEGGRQAIQWDLSTTNRKGLSSSIRSSASLLLIMTLIFSCYAISLSLSAEHPFLMSYCSAMYLPRLLIYPNADAICCEELYNWIQAIESATQCEVVAGLKIYQLFEEIWWSILSPRMLSGNPAFI